MNQEGHTSDNATTSGYDQRCGRKDQSPKGRRRDKQTGHKSSFAFHRSPLSSMHHLARHMRTEEEDRKVPNYVKNDHLCSFINSNEFGSDLIYKGVYGSSYVTYLDYTASARPLKCIESYIQKFVLPTYANTHTEVSYNAIQTTAFREEARDIIRKSVNADKDDCVIFTGSGVTSAINKLVHCLNLEQLGNVVVFIGPYEHHSNILPWVHSTATVMRIPQDKDGLFDIRALASTLKDLWNNPKMMPCSRPFIIGSFSAASNITGILTPTNTISRLIHEYHGVVFWDYACAGPYVPIDMNPDNSGEESSGQSYKDAVFISPHKFVGGPGTPGVLVAKRWLFQNPVPHTVGGGTVLFVRRTHHMYMSNPEHREEGGTPSIIESIRCGLVFKLKDDFGPEFIIRKEQKILRKALDYLGNVDGLVILGNTHVHRLPILPFLFYNAYTGRLVHHDFIATILNDVFGIQVRSGCACAGPYGMDLLGMSEQVAQKYEQLLIIEEQKSMKMASTKLTQEQLSVQNLIYKPGFVRINLPYFISDACFDFVMNALRLVAFHGWSLLPQYQYNADRGCWTHIVKTVSPHRVGLNDVSFASGSMDVHGNPSTEAEDVSDDSEDTSETQDKDYGPILKRAEGLFCDAISGLYDCEEDTDQFKGGLREELRWFMTPGEAANIIHIRQRKSRLKPKYLPFMPGALAAKLGINPRGHKGRGEEMDRIFVTEYFPPT